MTCRDYEKDLLLLLHGELSPRRRLRLRSHLRRCSRCRQRQEKLSDVSRLIAGAIRGPEMPPWLPERNHPFPRIRARYTYMCVLLVLLAGMLLYTTSVRRAANRAHLAVTPTMQRSSATGCTPNLPNDHCR